jgi:hypothetical protein
MSLNVLDVICTNQDGDSEFGFNNRLQAGPTLQLGHFPSILRFLLRLTRKHPPLP